MKNLLTYTLLLAILVVSCKPADDDGEHAHIEVINTHQHAVANAVIKLENNGIFTEVGKTNTEGHFYFDQVPGIYNITVESDDYTNDTIEINNWPVYKKVTLIRPLDSLYITPVFMKKINGVVSQASTIHSYATLRSVETDPYSTQNTPYYAVGKKYVNLEHKRVGYNLESGYEYYVRVDVDFKYKYKDGDVKDSSYSSFLEYSFTFDDAFRAKLLEGKFLSLEVKDTLVSINEIRE